MTSLSIIAKRLTLFTCPLCDDHDTRYNAPDLYAHVCAHPIGDLHGKVHSVTSKSGVDACTWCRVEDVVTR